MIRWIGWDVELDRKEQEIALNLLFHDDSDDETAVKEVKVEPLDRIPKDGKSRHFTYKDHDYKFDRYGLTEDGEAICVDAYAVLLASQPNTYVILH